MAAPSMGRGPGLPERSTLPKRRSRSASSSNAMVAGRLSSAPKWPFRTPRRLVTTPGRRGAEQSGSSLKRKGSGASGTPMTAARSAISSAWRRRMSSVHSSTGTCLRCWDRFGLIRLPSTSVAARTQTLRRSQSIAGTRSARSSPSLAPVVAASVSTGAISGVCSSAALSRSSPQYSAPKQ